MEFVLDEDIGKSDDKDIEFRNALNKKKLSSFELDLIMNDMN